MGDGMCHFHIVVSIGWIAATGANTWTFLSHNHDCLRRNPASLRGTARVSHEESRMIGKLCWRQSRPFALSIHLLGRERLFTTFVSRTNKVRFIIKEDDAFLRLDKFLMAKFDVPMKDIFKIIRRKEVKIYHPGCSEQRLPGTNKPNFRVEEGQLVEVFLPHEKLKINALAQYEKKTALKKEIPFPILWEDEHFVVVDKPQGISVHTGTKQTVTMATLLKQAGHQLLPVHRLDQDTSGGMIYAKKRKDARSIYDHFFTGKRISKIYAGVISYGGAERGAPLRTGEHYVEFGLVKTFHGVRPSNMYPSLKETITKTMMRPLKPPISSHGRQGIILRPLTGHKHQLRAVLAFQYQAPLVGDRKFAIKVCDHKLGGLTTDGVIEKLHLHAWKLEFDHPFTNEKICVESRLPSHIAPYVIS
jgi:23S rRNA-/tRNA-specific pseudouridylate synthase